MDWRVKAAKFHRSALDRELEVDAGVELHLADFSSRAAARTERSYVRFPP